MFSVIASVALSLALSGTPNALPVEVQPAPSIVSIVDREAEFWSMWDSLPPAFGGYKVEYVTTRVDGVTPSLNPFMYTMTAYDGSVHIYKVTKLYYA